MTTWINTSESLLTPGLYNATYKFALNTSQVKDAGTAHTVAEIQTVKCSNRFKRINNSSLLVNLTYFIF